MAGLQVKLSDLTPLERRKLALQVAARLEPHPNGCLTPRTKCTTVFIPIVERDIFIRRVVWMLEYGELPRRLYTSCRTSGCCCLSHLSDAPRKPRRPVGLIKTRAKRFMTDAQQREAYRLFFDSRLRLSDIAHHLNFSAAGVWFAIQREKKLTEAQKADKPRGQLVYPSPGLCGREHG